MQVKFYKKSNDRYPVMEFLEKLPSDESACIAGCLSNIEKLGFDSPRAIFKQIKGSLWEIKIKTYRSGYRFFYICLCRKNLILLHAYKKQSQKAPKKEINIAEKRMLEIIENDYTYIN